MEISSPRELTIAKRKEKAERQYEKYFLTSKVFFEQFQSAFDKADVGIEYANNSAFQLHQATENFFASILLVFTDYKPKLHDLDELEKKVVNTDKEFLPVFPKESEFQKECFKKLKEAYVRARYDMKYSITKEQLKYLGERVLLLKELTENKCQEKIASFVEN